MSDQATRTTSQKPDRIICSHCDRPIEGCGFCQNEECTVAVCERCVRSALRESMETPHAHGG